MNAATNITVQISPGRLTHIATEALLSQLQLPTLTDEQQTTLCSGLTQAYAGLCFSYGEQMGQNFLAIINGLQLPAEERRIFVTEGGPRFMRALISDLLYRATTRKEDGWEQTYLSLLQAEHDAVKYIMRHR